MSAVLAEQIRQDIDLGGNSTIIQEPQYYLLTTANKEDIAAFNELDLARTASSAVSTHPSIRVAKSGYYPQVQGGFSTEHNNRDFDRYDKRTLHWWTISASQILSIATGDQNDKRLAVEAAQFYLTAFRL